jgi:peptide/nickel transport system permease protein
VVGFSLPTLWVGLMLLLVFSIELDWLPSGRHGATIVIGGIEWSFRISDGLLQLGFTLALFGLALIIRLTRAATGKFLLPTSSSSRAPSGDRCVGSF